MYCSNTVLSLVDFSVCIHPVVMYTPSLGKLYRLLQLRLHKKLSELRGKRAELMQARGQELGISKRAHYKSP